MGTIEPRLLSEASPSEKRDSELCLARRQGGQDKATHEGGTAKAKRRPMEMGSRHELLEADWW